KSSVTFVAEDHVRCFQFGKLPDQLKYFTLRQLFSCLAGFGSIGHIDVLEVAQLPVADENVFISVQIDIEKNEPPRPIGSIHPSEERNLGKRAITATELKCVAIRLGSIVKNPNRPS